MPGSTAPYGAAALAGVAPVQSAEDELEHVRRAQFQPTRMRPAPVADPNPDATLEKMFKSGVPLGKLVDFVPADVLRRGRGVAPDSSTPKYASPFDAVKTPAGVAISPEDAGKALAQMGSPGRTPAPTAAPSPTLLAAGMAGISPDEAAKTLAQMTATHPAAPTFGAGDFGVSLQGIDPVIGAGINIRDNPAEQLAKMQLAAQRAAGESAAANAAQQNALHAQGLQQQQLSDFGRQQLGEQNLALSRQQFGLDQQKLAQMATEFNGRQALSREQMQSQQKIAGMPYSPDALRAAGNAALIQMYAQNAAKSPGGLRDAARQINDLVQQSQPAAATPGGPASPGGNQTLPPAKLPPDQRAPIDQLLDQIRPTLALKQGEQFTPEKIEKLLDAIGGASLNKDQQAALFGELKGAIPNPAHFGDLLVKAGTKALSATGPAAAGPIAPGQPGQVYYPQELGLPFQLQSNLNGVGQALRGFSIDPFTGANDPNNFMLYNEAQTNNGHVVPIDRADVLGPYARRNLTPAEQETHNRRLAASSNLLRAMMQNGLYR